jgi:uncharacterized membrane protein YfcA
MKRVGIFEEKPGWHSVNRVIFFAGCIWTMLFVTAGAFLLKWSPGEIVAVFSGLIVPFVGLKLVQKSMENSKIDPPENQPS